MSDPVLQGLIPGIERLAQTKVATHRLPGMALGIVRDQELAWFGGFGAADLESGAKPTEETIARVASVTKTFTATAIMQLRDEGRLTLEDPLARHVPEFASARAVGGYVEGVTIRRLLTHRSGLVTESPTHGWAALDFPSREEILARLPETGIVIPQDSAFKYSNLAFALLGEVIYRVSGTPYTEYIHTHIIEPLGLTSTVFDLTDYLRPRFFTGYNPSPWQDRPERAPYAHLNGISAGGQLHSTVSDLARWVSFQFRGGGLVLSPETVLEIQRPQYVEPDWSAGQCIGWRATRIGDRVHHNHGGGIHGFATQVWFNAPGRTGVVLLINMWPPSRRPGDGAGGPGDGAAGRRGGAVRTGTAEARADAGGVAAVRRVLPRRTRNRREHRVARRRPAAGPPWWVRTLAARPGDPRSDRPGGEVGGPRGPRRRRDGPLHVG